MVSTLKFLILTSNNVLIEILRVISGAVSSDFKRVIITWRKARDW